MVWTIRGLTLFGLVFAVGCVQPAHTVRKSRELAYLQSTGDRLQIHRCGTTQPISGFTLHHVDESFPPDTAASRHGRSAEVYSGWATGLSILSGALSVAGLVLVLTADYDAVSGVPDQSAAGIGLAAGALVPGAVAGALAASSRTRLLDAVNAYNEETFAHPDAACADRGPEPQRTEDASAR